MGPNSNLILRNMGRGTVGNIAGSYGGALLGGLGGLALGGSDASMQMGEGLGRMVGGLGGSWLASNKYSSGAARKIMRRNKRENIEQENRDRIE